MHNPMLKASAAFLVLVAVGSYVSALIQPENPAILALRQEVEAIREQVPPIEGASDFAKAVVASNETGLVEMLPPERIAAFLEPPKDQNYLSPEDDPAVRAEIAKQILVASDRQYMLRQMGSTSTLEAWADYWLSIWPELDRLVLDGSIKRSIAHNTSSPNPGSWGVCILLVRKDAVSCVIHSEHWSLTLEFPKDRSPNPELLARVYN